MTRQQPTPPPEAPSAGARRRMQELLVELGRLGKATSDAVSATSLRTLLAHLDEAAEGRR